MLQSLPTRRCSVLASALVYPAANTAWNFLLILLGATWNDGKCYTDSNTLFATPIISFMDLSHSGSYPPYELFDCGPRASLMHLAVLAYQFRLLRHASGGTLLSVVAPRPAWSLVLGFCVCAALSIGWALTETIIFELYVDVTFLYFPALGVLLWEAWRDEALAFASDVDASLEASKAHLVHALEARDRAQSKLDGWMAGRASPAERGGGRSTATPQ